MRMKHPARTLYESYRAAPLPTVGVRKSREGEQRGIKSLVDNEATAIKPFCNRGKAEGLARQAVNMRQQTDAETTRGTTRWNFENERRAFWVAPGRRGAGPSTNVLGARGRG